MTEWVEQQICVKFCIKLEHSSMENIWMIQKVAAMGDWWLAASLTMHVLMHQSGAEFFGKTSNHPSDSATLQPRFDTLWLLAKLKSPLKGRRFQTISEIEENTTGELMAIGRTVWGPKVPSLKRTEVSFSYVQCFLYLVSSSINVSVFHIIWLDTFLKQFITFWHILQAHLVSVCLGFLFFCFLFFVFPRGLQEDRSWIGATTKFFAWIPL